MRELMNASLGGLVWVTDYAAVGGVGGVTTHKRIIASRSPLRKNARGFVAPSPSLRVASRTT